MAKHLQIARTKGARAGFEALVEYLTTPLGLNNPRMADIIEALDGQDEDDAFQWYCERFLADHEATRPTSGVLSIRRAQKGSTSSRKTTQKARGRKAAPKVANSAITSGEAWEALGADAGFEPNDGSRPATNGQLYRLNTLGLISLVEA